MVILEVAMTGEISIAKGKARFAALIDRAEAGEQIIITRNGRPVACVGPLPAKKPIIYGDLRGLQISDDLSLPNEVLGDFEKSSKRLARQLKTLKQQK